MDRKGNMKPAKPQGLNGDHAALWGMLEHVNDRIDKLYVVVVGGMFAVGSVVIGTLAAVLVK